MGDRIQINRMAERFSSHSLTHPYRARPGALQDTQTLRGKLIGATIEVVAEGKDPRLSETRARA